MAKTYQFPLLSINKLFVYGRLEYEPANQLNKLIIKKENFEFLYKDLKNRFVNKREDSCQLFKQFKFEFGDEDINNAFIILDFESANKGIYNSLCTVSCIVIEDSDGNREIFEDFLKSSSMAAKKKQVYYINLKYKERLTKRTTFNIENYCKKSITIPKWYSATGLLLSTATILDNVTFNSDEICVVPDFEKKILAPEVVTAISLRSLSNDINEITKAIENCTKGDIDSANEKDKEEIKKYFNNIHNISLSDDIDNITDQNIKDILSFFKTDYGDDIKEIKNACDDAKKIYSTRNLLVYSEEKIDWYKISVKDFYVTSNLFDGEGLVSEECSEEINNQLALLKIKDKAIFEDESTEEIITNAAKSGSFQIRLPFIKGVIHTANLKQFFIDHGVTKIKCKSYIDFNNKDYLKEHNLLDVKDVTLIEYDVSKIKIILTQSQVKFLSPENLTNMFFNSKKSPIESYFEMLKSFKYGIGINNIDPKNDSLIKMNHEFWSTLPLSPTSKFFDTIKERLFANTEKDLNKISSAQYLVKSLKETLRSSNYYELDNKYADVDQEFYFQSKRGKKFVEKQFNDYLDDVLLGKIKIPGYRRFLVSDLLGLLYRIIRQEMPRDEYLSPHQFFAAKRLPAPVGNTDNNEISYTFLRAPHYSRNEIVVLKQKTITTERNTYFGKLKSVVMVNALSLSAERLSGADYDGDCVFIICMPTVNFELAQNLKKGNYRYPLVCIPSIKRDAMNLTIKNKVTSWRYGFDSKIGIISNIAFQQALESYKDDIKTVNNDMCFYTLISGIDIDAKKTGYLPSKYFIDLPKNTFAKNFLNNKETPRKINKDLSTGSHNILTHIINEFSDMEVPNVVVGEKHKSKHLIKDVAISKNKEKISKVIEKYFVYETFLEYQNSIKNSMNLVDYLANFLTNKCKDNNLSLSELAEVFETSNAIETLEKYRDNKMGTPYHFLIEEKDKINFLKKLNFESEKLQNYLELYYEESDHEDSVDSKIKNAVKTVISFSNDGFKTLYFLIQYQRYSKMTMSTQEEDLDSFITSTLRKNINAKISKYSFKQDDINGIIDTGKVVLFELINEYESCYGSLRKEFNIKESLDNKYGILSINAVASICKNIQNDETICVIFSKEIINYLENGRQDNAI